jgi:hypothetical protein
MPIVPGAADGTDGGQPDRERLDTMHLTDRQRLQFIRWMLTRFYPFRDAGLRRILDLRRRAVASLISSHYTLR